MTATKSISVVEDRREVFVTEKGKPPREVYLSPSEWKVFTAMRADSKVWTREQLAKVVGIPKDDVEVYVAGRTVEQHVCRVKKKLGSDVISTVQRTGYKIARQFAA